MQILQIQQIAPQTQTQAGSSDVELVKSSVSFADELKAAENRSKSTEEKKVSPQEDRKRTEEVASREKNEGISEKSPEKTDSRLSEKGVDSENEEKIHSDRQKSLSKSEEKKDSEEIASVENQIALVQSLSSQEGEVKVRFTGEAGQEGTGEIQKVQDTDFAWLFNQTSDAEGAAMSGDEKIADLLANVEEFVPGTESEKEKLENAQNLSSTDPVRFLQNVEDAQFASGGEKLPSEHEGKSAKTEEVKGKKSPFRLEIKDLRSEKNGSDAENGKIVARISDKKTGTYAYGENGASQSRSELTMELLNESMQNSTSSNAQVAASDGSTFQSQLAQAVQENAPEFVKAGSIVLKDNNKGAINLILHPESLGNVKVHLSLSDKLITGTINVQSREAYEAFKESISAIKEAFAQSGFETGSFDLNFSNGSQGQFAQNQNSDNSQMFKGRSAYGDFVTPQQFFESSESEVFETTSYGVNIVA